MIDAIVKFETLGECENVIREGVKGLVHAGKALHYIKEKQLYEGHGYNDFEHYCLGRWNFSMNYGNRLIRMFEVVQILIDNKIIEPNDAIKITGNSVRTLTKLQMSNQEKYIPEVYRGAMKENGGQLPTGKQVAKAVEKFVPSKVKKRKITISLDEERYQDWAKNFKGLTAEQQLLYLIECDIASYTLI